MKNLISFTEFINESNNVQLTVKEYIELSDGDEEWTKIANNCLKFLKSKENSSFWITSEDEDDKFDDMTEYWDNNAKHTNITKLICGESEGPDGRGSGFYGDPKIPMIKYEANGLDAYIMPISVYNKM
jgi:hypothetical protein